MNGFMIRKCVRLLRLYFSMSMLLGDIRSLRIVRTRWLYTRLNVPYYEANYVRLAAQLQRIYYTNQAEYRSHSLPS